MRETKGIFFDLGIYKVALLRLGLEAKYYIFIDDNKNCVAVAGLTGIRSILFKDA